MAAPTAALATRSPEATATKPLEATSASPNPSTDVPNAKNVTSPGELCGYVDTLLNTLEQRFDDMSEQVL